MSNHTQGPWEVSYRETILDESMRAVGSATKLVAMVKYDDDARLIAAAPELLEACRFALAEVELDVYPVASVLRAAILKAEGRE